ncbi:MAG: hypothetical protein M1600_00180 [Firmicutes bacterium]|jgi:hypothetical protein|nr:hypothetical protein [Bacillota bacterium]
MAIEQHAIPLNATEAARYQQLMQWGEWTEAETRVLFVQHGLEGLALEAALHLYRTRPLSTGEISGQVGIPRLTLLHAIQARNVAPYEESEWDPEAYAAELERRLKVLKPTPRE